MDSALKKYSFDLNWNKKKLEQIPTEAKAVVTWSKPSLQADLNVFFNPVVYGIIGEMSVRITCIAIP